MVNYISAILGKAVDCPVTQGWGTEDKKMKEVITSRIRWEISLLLVMLYFSGLPAQAQYVGGSGTADSPYLIYTAEQMNAIGANLATEIIKNKLPSAKVIDLSTSII